LAPLTEQLITDFTACAGFLKHALQQPLPGLNAQRRMYPHTNGELQHRPAGTADRKSAVLVLVYPMDNVPYVLFTLRHSGLKHHSGQISFPGGMIEPGESPEQAALREAQEETALDPSKVEIIGRLTDLVVIHSRNHVIPVVGCCPETPAFKADPVEVGEIICVPLAHLLDPSRRKERPAQFDNRTWTVPYYDIHNVPLWGATAIITAEFNALFEQLS
jgi:8-oxo-dGTP pyrophosphatase MutT (NUDIX family)